MRAKERYCAHMQSTVRTEHTTELARAIDASGLKKIDLAAKAGISPSHLTRALLLERPIARRALEVIAVELGIELDSFYDGRRLLEHTSTCSYEQERTDEPAVTEVPSA